MQRHDGVFCKRGLGTSRARLDSCIEVIPMQTMSRDCLSFVQNQHCVRLARLHNVWCGVPHKCRGMHVGP